MTIKQRITAGFILPTTIVMTMVGAGVVFAYYQKAMAEHHRVSLKIAKTKAKYNAGTGLAIKTYEDFFMEEVMINNSDTIRRYEGEDVDGMGKFDSVSIRIRKNKGGQLIRVAKSKGYSTVQTFWGNGSFTLEDSVSLITEPQKTLATYLYLTGSEKAGGAPQTMENGVRREVNFGSGDNLNAGDIQSNGQLVMSDFGCPTFNTTVTITEECVQNPDGTFDTEVNYPDMGFCNENSVFQGSPPLDTLPPVCLPPPSFDSKKAYADVTLDATELLKWSPFGLKDTLIMTEIEFVEDGGFFARRWWYLMPPHLKAGISLVQASAPQGADLEGVTNANFQCIVPSNLRTCSAYAEALINYHVKEIDTDGNETLIDDDIQGTHGFHHYDTHVYQYDPSNPNSAFSTGSANVVSEEFYPYNHPTAIYIKGGQVLVHGRYKGKYTIITDENTAYRRHAWSPNFSSPIDTIWNNIWLVDDIRNVDGSTNGNLYSVQPDEDCTGGSSNVMGIVSGANVFIANTKANGARGSSYGSSIVIHAHIIAFNESFSMHYWQNRTQSPYGCANGSVWGAGYGDCNGDRFGGNFSGQSDLRGTVNLWGGVVQKYRGYMKRNQPGPYNISPGIGMDKNYHYDNNLKCYDPPLYPESVFCNDESCGGEATEGENQINLKIASYREF
jgi:hypothetical protein